MSWQNKCCFSLFKEFENLRSQFVTSNNANSRGGRRYLPFVFTENGVAMLSAVLRSEKAVKISMLAVDRILSINGSYEDGKPSCDMAFLQDLLSDPFGISCESEPYKVKLFIDSYQTPFEKEKQWPKGKVFFEDTESGTVMTATTRTIFDVQRYILKRTPHIKVLSPDGLRGAVVQALKDGIEMNISERDL